jgi:hypothetical protein
VTTRGFVVLFPDSFGPRGVMTDLLNGDFRAAVVSRNNARLQGAKSLAIMTP